MSRIKPVEEPYEPKVAQSLAKWTLPDFTGEPPLLFRVFHVYPELASRCRVMGAGLLAHGRLPAWDRELIVDRVTGRYGALQEWGMHATFYSPPAGLTEQHIQSVAGDPSADGDLWDPEDLELFAAVDELCDTTELTERTWESLVTRYDEQQLLEFIIVVGWYRMISSMCNGLKLAPETYHPVHPTRPTYETEPHGV
jgi:alkylhydroperoxidase family enzyme